MKYCRIFGTLALAAIFSLLLVALPAAPAHAVTKYIYLDPEEGRIGERVDIDGEGFIPGSLSLYFSKYPVTVGDPITTSHLYEYLGTAPVDEYNEFSDYFLVPDELTKGSYATQDVTSGRYYVYALELGVVVAGDYFDVIAGEITVYPTRGPVETEVQIDGTGFADNENIEIEFDGYEVDIESGDDETDNDGDFTSYIIIPESAAGNYTITVYVGGAEAEDDFTVEPEITLDQTSGAPGTDVTITGAGFGDRVDIEAIYFGSVEVDIVAGDTDTNSDGYFESTVTVPSLEPGTYDVEVEDDDGNSAEAEFTIAISFTINPTTGDVGTQITASGSGFPANTTITVTYYDSAGTTALTQVTTTSLTDETFTAALNAPASLHGDHNVTATDGTSTMTATFIMESIAPPVPALVLPEDATKVNSKPTFEWGAVTDPSLPVTYDLQVASDATFTTILVNQTGLTGTEYTLTDEEELERTEEEAPYYWRVRAVDGASNIGQWSAAGTFHVGGLSLPGLPWWAILAICAGCFFPLGFFVGRRTAYSYY